MRSFEPHEVAFNLVLFKKLRYYHLFNTNSTKVLNYNVYRLGLVALTAIVLCVTVFGLLGFITKMEDIVDDIVLLQIISGEIYNFLSIFKLNICLYHANKIWDVLDVTRIDFLTSKLCSNHINILHRYRNTSIRITYFLCVIYALTTSVWLTAPLIFNAFMETSETERIRRYDNIFNFRFPVTIDTYNHYYFLFYFAEGIIISFIGYAIFIIDLLLISISYVLIAQYEIHAQAFKSIRSDLQEFQNEYEQRTDDYKDFESIIYDQQKLYEKLQTYNAIVWPIIMWTVAATSGVIIILSYSFVVIFLAAESLEILTIIKFASTVIFFSIEIFIHCYLLENINTRKESVNFGIYCCNWTAANLKFKKLMLLTMQMNDATNLMIKISPTKAINLNFFSNVMMTCYNIVSVMLRKRSTNI